MSIFHDIQFKWPHNLVLGDAIVTWLGMLVVLHILCMLMWPWPDARSRSGSRAFELLTTSEAVHAGGDDRSPLARLSGRPMSVVAKQLDAKMPLGMEVRRSQGDIVLDENRAPPHGRGSMWGQSTQ